MLTILTHQSGHDSSGHTTAQDGEQLFFYQNHNFHFLIYLKFMYSSTFATVQIKTSLEFWEHFPKCPNKEPPLLFTTLHMECRPEARAPTSKSWLPPLLEMLGMDWNLFCQTMQGEIERRLAGLVATRLPTHHRPS